MFLYRSCIPIDIKPNRRIKILSVALPVGICQNFLIFFTHNFVIPISTIIPLIGTELITSHLLKQIQLVYFKGFFGNTGCFVY